MRDHTEDTITISLSDLDESGMVADSSYTIDVSDITTTFGSTTTIDTINTTSTINDGLTITLDDPHWADNITWEQVEFEDSMPSIAKVEDMCNDYPALAKAYENFKTIYAMVHQDWKGRQENDDQMPF